MLTVLPGETAVFTVSRRGGMPLEVPGDLSLATQSPVIRCIGDSAALSTTGSAGSDSTQGVEPQ